MPNGLLAAGPPEGADVISEARLRAYLTFIASDLLEGRDTGTRGLDIAAGFLASHLARLGYEPGGDDGTYFQRIPLTRRQLNREQSALVVRPGASAVTLAFGRDYVTGTTGVAGEAEGGIVYVGFGTTIPSRGLTPFKDIDVRGKFVVLQPGLPVGITPRDLAGLTRGKDWEPAEEAAASRGAIGILYLPDYSTLTGWDAMVTRATTRPTLTVDAFEAEGPARLPSAYLNARAIDAIFAKETVPPQEVFQRAVRREPAAPFALSEAAVVRLRTAMSEEQTRTQNVVAILRGADPKLRDEYVAIGAHYDHVGIGATPDARGDRIFNGADDDGSGTVGILSVAEAFANAKRRPKRSLLFVWHAGEERGLWGSRYFTDHPTVPIDRIVAQFNVDMIGRSRPAGEPASGSAGLTDENTVYLVGATRLSDELGATVERVNKGYHRLTFDYALDAPDDPQRIYERSDHYNYARKGIPIAFFFTGLHAEYHRPGDEVELIDFRKLQRVSQTIYAVTREVADAATRPAVRPAPVVTESK